MARKQIAIVTRHMITGGVERALIAMLKQFDYEEVNIDLYLEQPGGELLLEVPTEVSVQQLPTIKKENILEHPFYALRKGCCLMKLKQNGLSYIQQNFYSSKLLVPSKKVYDIAISYHAPNTVPVFYVIDQIRAEKKILWLHGDMTANSGSSKLAMKYHECYDKVFAVSESVLKSFLNLHPDMKNQTQLFCNYVDVEGIKKKAMEGPVFLDEFDGLRLLSIGRLDRQKGFDIAVEACSLLKCKGYHFRWYVCGEGSQRTELERMIQERGLNNEFILLGNQPNPYGYLNTCDLYIQPSRTEGYCTTTNEARVLHKAVITTDVSGMQEQFEHNITGWIVPIGAEALCKEIIKCIEQPERIKKMQEELKRREILSEDNISKVFE